MSKKLIIEEVEKRIKEIHGDIIKLDVSTYVNIGTKARFIDKDYGEFWAKPSNIFMGQGCRKRGIEKISTSAAIRVKYTEEDVKKWVEYYNISMSAEKTGKHFHVGKCTILKYFRKFKDKLNIKSKIDKMHELEKEGRKFCNGCGEIKDINEFHCDQCKCKLCQKQYATDNKGEIKEYKKTYHQENKEKIKEYNEKNKVRNRKRNRAHKKERYKNDINYRISENLRSRLHSAVKNDQKAGSAIRDLGCSIDFLKLSLEYRFYLDIESGRQMTWENYGEWHIDHIIPLSSFDLSDREQLLKACHYTNLQPLWAKDNFSKSDKIL